MTLRMPIFGSGSALWNRSATCTEFRTYSDQCATGFVKDGLRARLLEVSVDARMRFGPVHWNQYKTFMVAFDRGRAPIAVDVELPLIKPIPQSLSGSDGRVHKFPLAMPQFMLTYSPLDRTSVL